MSTFNEIDSAISAHAQWKHKLLIAIETGKSESPPEKVKQDNKCSFGIWLHERIDSDAKASPLYTEVVALHAKFHIEAGEILALALSGNDDNKNVAHERMKLGGAFSGLSGELTQKMQAWKASL